MSRHLGAGRSCSRRVEVTLARPDVLCLVGFSSGLFDLGGTPCRVILTVVRSRAMMMTVGRRVHLHHAAGLL